MFCLLMDGAGLETGSVQIITDLDPNPGRLKNHEFDSSGI